MQHKSVDFKLEGVEGRTFAGYASTWDEDEGGDIIVPGAFSKTIKERQKKVKVMYNHKTLIGRPEVMREETKGLYVEGYISDVSAGNDVLTLMKDNALNEMSITYAVPHDKFEYRDSGGRIIRELKLYEFGPVDMAMNENAIITGVKSVKDAIQAGNLDKTSIVELKSMLEDLTALLSTEPQKSTQDATQPPELDALYKSIQNFGR